MRTLQASLHPSCNSCYMSWNDCGALATEWQALWNIMHGNNSVKVMVFRTATSAAKHAQSRCSAQQVVAHVAIAQSYMVFSASHKAIQKKTCATTKKHFHHISITQPDKRNDVHMDTKRIWYSCYNSGDLKVVRRFWYGQPHKTHLILRQSLVLWQLRVCLFYALRKRRIVATHCV